MVLFCRPSRGVARWAWAVVFLGSLACGESASDKGESSITAVDIEVGLDVVGDSSDSLAMEPQDVGVVPDQEGPEARGSSDIFGDLDLSTVMDSATAPETNPSGDLQDGEQVTSQPVYIPGMKGPFTYEKGVHEIQVGEGQGPGPFQTDKTHEVHIYTPEGAVHAPGVVFVPGFQLGADNFSYLGEHLASHGFVVLIPTIGDSLFNAETHVDLAARVSIFLDWLEENAPVDPERLAAGGHSRGGKVAILSALDETRIRATFNLDPVDTGAGPFGVNADNPSVTPEMMDKLVVPAGFVGAGLSANGFQPCAPAADNYHQYFVEAKQAYAVEYLLKGAGHNDFAQSVSSVLGFACEEGNDPDGAKFVAKSAMVAFYQVFLNGVDAYRPWVDGEQAPAGAEITVYEP